MKYEIRTGEDAIELEASRDALGRAWRVIDSDGKTHEFKAEEIDADVMRIVIAGSAHTITLLPGNRPGQSLRFLLDGRHTEVDVRDDIDRLTEVLREAGGAGGSEELRSVMPGVIRKVNVAVGDAVAIDQPILILEAMKMENEIGSPRDGVIGSLAMAEGDTVNTGDLLAVIDPPAEE